MRHRLCTPFAAIVAVLCFSTICASTPASADRADFVRVTSHSNPSSAGLAGSGHAAAYVRDAAGLVDEDATVAKWIALNSPGSELRALFAAAFREALRRVAPQVPRAVGQELAPSRTTCHLDLSAEWDLAVVAFFPDFFKDLRAFADGACDLGTDVEEEFIECDAMLLVAAFPPAGFGFDLQPSPPHECHAKTTASQGRSGASAVALAVAFTASGYYSAGPTAFVVN